MFQSAGRLIHRYVEQGVLVPSMVLGIWGLSKACLACTLSYGSHCGINRSPQTQEAFCTSTLLISRQTFHAIYFCISPLASIRMIPKRYIQHLALFVILYCTESDHSFTLDYTLHTFPQSDSFLDRKTEQMHTQLYPPLAICLL